MSRPRRNDFLIPTLAVLFDIIAIEISFLLSYWLRFETSALNFLPLTEDMPQLDAYVYGSFVIIPIWLVIFNSRKMYGARRNVALADDFYSIIKLVTVGMLVVMSAAFFYRAFSYSRIVFGLLWISSIINIFLGRFILLQIEKTLYKKGRELRNAVIVGDNQTANRIFTSLYKHPLLGYRLVGYFSDYPTESSMQMNILKYLGKLDGVPDKLIEERIELVLVALNYDEHPKLYKLVQECEGVNVEFMMVPDLLEIMTGGMIVKEVEGIPFIKIKGVPMTTWGRLSKRTFDVVFSSLFLLLSSPLLLIIVIAIKLSSKGPIFFIQDRVGLDGNHFRMIKFRSMIVGAEKYDEQAGLGIQNDPRRTRIGKLLRRTSLDELPQLINVWKGEMSLVGPRPERPYFVEQFKSLVPKYLDRHRVKTGVTGWAQVNGFRGDSSIEERIKYDIYYIENWSFWFDIKILLKTIRAII
ncbi:MAG: undecaprenyl-phosphate glucose phosphotransferase [Ignavibacteriales bacterium]|nr:undecaprenyl-phosphate glucose phosphotransferase [Ignavibacteriales bacterium]